MNGGTLNFDLSTSAFSANDVINSSATVTLNGTNNVFLRSLGGALDTANSYTLLVPNGLTPEQIAFWTRALDKVIVDPDFKLDLERNFWALEPIRYPDTIKWMNDDYDENRAVLKELGMLQ